VRPVVDGGNRGHSVGILGTLQGLQRLHASIIDAACSTGVGATPQDVSAGGASPCRTRAHSGRLRARP
jgi:hypothetical protein